MHAVKNGIFVLGISVCLSSSPATAQDRAAPRTHSGPAPAAHSATPAGTIHAGSVQGRSVQGRSVQGRSVQARTMQTRSAQASSGYRSSGVAQAVAQGGPAPGAVRQVAGQQSPRAARGSSGLLGGWFGGDDNRQSSAREPQSLFERLGLGDDEPAAAPAQRANAAAARPDWEGVPYHRPHRSANTGGSAPITDPKDPSNRQLSQKLAQPARPAVNPQIPVPPAEEAPRRRERSSAQIPTPSDSASDAASSYEALSDTESSRRSGRRVVDPLDAYLAAEPEAATASPVHADGQGPIADRGLADGPRVARRPVPAVSNAATSRRRTAATAGTGSEKSMPPSLAAASEGSTPSAESAATTGIASGEAATAADGASSDDAWQASAPKSPATESTTASSPATKSSTAQTPTVPAAQPQLGVQARNTVDGSLEPANTVTSVNTQPVNVVSEIPGIRVVTSGPAEIPIRQAVDYEIRVENRGALAAPGALIRVTLPRWIGVQAQKASRGEIAEESNQKEQQLLWQVEGLPAGATETLTLGLSAVEARQFDVAVEWAVLPQSNIAHVQVLEPKLELVIEGPDKVVYGESQSYKVRVLNPGNGNAENVVFTLSPNSKTPQSQQIGRIPAGKEAHFEVELTARDRESLQIHGLAVGGPGLESELTKSIEVIAADLEAVLSGPPLRYQASSAAYKLEITNRGDAACEQLAAVLRLPAGVKYEGGLPQADASGSASGAAASSNVVEWQVGQLAPGESAEYEFHCLMQETGEQQIAFQCEGTAAGAADVVFTTSVEALADLVLSVEDPTAPAPVGEEVTYEIVLRNRGSKAAVDVQVLAQFSDNVEPVRVEGSPGQVAPGQVVFDPIPRVEPGAELRLTVVAKAEKAGLHRFRSEVSSGEILLISEEATRYIELAGERVSQRSSETETK